tara:strand:+ start:536 stop:670 length:135 start_codon:yes stop_codon:yes gene_type:complete
MLHAGAKRRSVKRSIGKIEMYFIKYKEGTKENQVSSQKLSRKEK